MDRGGTRRAGDDRRARRRARRGPLRGLGDRAAGAPTRGSPRDEIAVFYRVNAQSRVLEDTLVRFEIPYQVIGGDEVLRAGRDQGRDRLPEPARQPGRRGLVRADRQLAAPRDRRDDPGAAALARQHHRAGHLGGVLGAGAASRPRPGGAARRCAASPRRCAACASAPSRRRPAGRRAARGGAHRERLPGGAPGRANDRGRGAGREPPGAGRRRRRVRRQPRAGGRERGRRRWRSSWPRSRSTPTRTRCSDDESLMHADDPPQRQGPRVRGRVHDRLRGGRLPAHRARSRRATSRRSAASATSG